LERGESSRSKIVVGGNDSSASAEASRSCPRLARAQHPKSSLTAKVKVRRVHEDATCLGRYLRYAPASAKTFGRPNTAELFIAAMGVVDAHAITTNPVRWSPSIHLLDDEWSTLA